MGRELITNNSQLYEGEWYPRNEDGSEGTDPIIFKFNFPQKKKRQNDNYVIEGFKTTSESFSIEIDAQKYNIQADDIIKIPRFNLDGNVSSVEPLVIGTMLVANAFRGANSFRKLVTVDV